MAEFRALLSGSGEMGARITAHDWTATPLGTPHDWPQSLRSALSICLNSGFPSAIYWGEDLRLLYNDAWAPILGDRHPQALGEAARKVWPDLWPLIGSQLRNVYRTGRGYTTTDQALTLERSKWSEETYWDQTFSPIAGEDGRVAGILNQALEVTGRVAAQRRNALLVAFNDRVRPLDSAGEIAAAGAELVGRRLGSGRVGYGKIDEDEDVVRVEACWTDGTMPHLPNGFRLELAGDDVRRLLRSGESVRIEDCENDPRLADWDVRERYARNGVRAEAIVPVLRQGRYAAAIFAQAGAPGRWSENDEAMLREVGLRISQETARARVAGALRDSEERHRLIFEQAHDIIFTADLDQTITACNPAAAAALGIPAGAVVGASISDFVSAEDFQRTGEMLRRKMAAGGTTKYEIEVNGAGGRVMQWEINSALARDRDGQIVGLHAIARDITERHASDQRQALLIHELNHRVKNTLALVQGLAMQSFRPGRTPAQQQAAFEARLGALAVAHDLLTSEKWEGATFGALARSAVEAVGGARIALSGPEVLLSPKAAVSVVMAFHELATNAVKYGALSEADGRVTLEWGTEDGRLKVAWRELGGPPAAQPKRRGFGLKLIQRALATDLGGEVAVTFTETGLTCLIDAPLPAPPGS